MTYTWSLNRSYRKQARLYLSFQEKLSLANFFHVVDVDTFSKR